MQVRKIYLSLPYQMVKMENNTLENNPLKCKLSESRDYFAHHYIPITRAQGLAESWCQLICNIK